MNYLAYNKLAGQVTDEKIQEILKKFEDRFPNMQLIDKSVTGLEVLNERLSDDDNVLLIGGDGTVNVFANEWNTTKVKGNWYIYSAGTGNDFLNDIEAQDGFGYLNPYMDNLPQVTANGITKYFVNNVGFGIDGDCCVVAEQNKAKGKKVNYTKIVIGLILGKFRKRKARVVVDGKEYNFKRVFLAATMNGRYYGGGMKSAPKQDRNSDKISLVVMTGISRVATLIKFTKIFTGEHVKYKNVTIIEGHDIEVEFDKPCGLQYDGEVILNVKSYKAKK